MNREDYERFEYVEYLGLYGWLCKRGPRIVGLFALFGFLSILEILIEFVFGETATQQYGLQILGFLLLIIIIGHQNIDIRTDSEIKIGKKLPGPWIRKGNSFHTNYWN